jgi:hypothetical protein
LNFQQQNSFKSQYIPHLKYENYEINFIKSNSTTTFQQHQKHLSIQVKFVFMILLMFIKKWFNNRLPLHRSSKNFQPISAPLFIVRFSKISITLYEAIWFGKFQLIE